MTKSKAKSSTIRSSQGDFKLQSKQRLTPRMAKVQSRSCSPVQSPSPTSIPPRSKVAFADFVNFSSDARVFNPLGSDMNFDHQKMCRGKTKVSNSLHRSKQTVSSPLPAQGHSSMPCPNERIPTTPGIIMPQAGCSQIPLTGSTPGTSHSPSLVHFPGFTSSAACHIQGADVSEPVEKWQFYLVSYVAGKFPGYSAMQSFINRTWQHKVNFSMHDSGWLIFDFSSETEMLDVVGVGPYPIFGRPVVLQIMPDFFDFQFTELTYMPTWVRFPNLPLRCWNHICLSKIASMIGKPIHCDGPTTQMTQISYARVLIEEDLLSDLPFTINVLLPNGNTLVHQLVYESLPRFCKQCKSLGHSTLTCNKGHTTRNRKRPHDNSTCSVRSSPSAKTAAVEKQDPYCAGPSSNFREDPMSTEAAAADLPSTQPPDCKRSKADGSKSIDPGKKANASKVPRRQYLTQSKAAVTSCLGLKPNTPADCGEFPVQLLLFVSDLVIDSLRLASCGCYSIFAPGVGLLTTL
ncbi:hypothetical protein NC652_027086 [Populus alba x Populus x berolinensis]|nr:hypothetical protein NC652_027086 [Populus alba x Populus x berolinensis]